MNKSVELEAILTVAKHHNISEVRIREEMQHAIDTAMENAEFAKVFGEGVRPSPEEFIRVISNMAKSESKKK